MFTNTHTHTHTHTENWSNDAENSALTSREKCIIHKLKTVYDKKKCSFA